MFIIPGAHDNLARWSVQASLGKMIYEIVQKLMQEPPQILQTIPTTPQPTGYPSYLPSNSQPPVKNAPYQQPSLTNSGKGIPDVKTHTPLPVIPSSFPEVEAKSTQELSQMLNDETEFNRFFESLSAVQTMKKVRDDLRIANEELAKKNLAKEAEVDRVRRELESRNRTVMEKRAAFEQKAQRQQEVMKQFSTPALIEQLTLAAQEAEMASDDIANKFLGGQIDYKDFIREFIERRKLFHLRSAKKESLMMLGR